MDAESLLPSPASLSHEKPKNAPSYTNKLPFSRIFTFNVIATLVANSLLNFGNGTYNNIFFTFQSTPVHDDKAGPPGHTPQNLLHFTGGLGLPPRDVGIAMAILGVVGIILQIFLYPIVNARLGTVRMWRACLCCFPIVYVATPFLALVPSSLPSPAPKSGLIVWVCICGVLFVQSMARTFATPAAAILLHNCSPHPSVLGTVHGIGQSANSAMKTIGPALGGWLYGVSLDRGVVGAAFWGLAAVATVDIVAACWVREGDGYETRVDGDEESEK